MKAPEAFKVLCRQEAEKLIDHDKATQEALERTEKSGIIFIDVNDWRQMFFWALSSTSSNESSSKNQMNPSGFPTI